VTTGTGDDGYTRLLGPERVPKHDPRVEACGDFDEASSALGLARASVAEPGLREAIREAQRDLYILMGELASTPATARQLSRRIGADDVRRLESLQAALLAEVEIAREFVVPGGTFAGAALDLARTVVRRAERRLARVLHDGLVENQEALRYVNRLSDVLFVMARYVERSTGRTDGLVERSD
jgi:cob(I)alamin adenosyltransferase